MPAGPGSGAKIAEAYVDIGANTTALQAGMMQAKRQFNKAAAAIESRAQKMASTLKQAWKAAAVGTAVLTAGVGKAVDMYMEFEDAQVELQKKLGATQAEVQNITDDLTELSMRLPTTRQELTEVAAASAKVGVSADNVVAYTKIMKMFEEATGMAATQAALFFGRINEISQAPITTVENLGSAIAYLLDNFPVAEAEKITQVMLKMGRTVIGAMDASQAELAGLATAISSVSRRATRPATQLMRAFLEMGEKTQEYADIVEMSTERLRENINENAIGAFVDWIKRFKQLYDESNMTADRIRAFADVSQAAAKGILPFVSNVELLERSLNAAMREFDKNEALAIKYQIALTRLSTQLEITRGNVATAAQAFGGIFAPAIRRLNKNALQPLTARLVYVMTQSQETREAIRSMVLSLIKVGGAITGIGLLVKALTMLASPVFQVMALAGALWAAWELNMWNIRGAIDETITAFENLGKKIGKVKSQLGIDFKWTDISMNLQKRLREEYGLRKDVASAAALGARAMVFTAVWWGTGSFWLGTVTATIGVNFAFKIWEDAKQGFKEGINKIERGLKSDKKNFIDLVTGKIGFVEYAKRQWGSAKKASQDLPDFMLEFETQGVEAVKRAWTWWKNHTGKPIKDLTLKLIVFFKKDMQALWEKVKAAWNWWRTHTGKPMKEGTIKLAVWFKKDMQKLWQRTKEAWQWWKNNVDKPAQEAVVSFFVNFPENMQDLWGLVKKAWQWCVQNIDKPARELSIKLAIAFTEDMQALWGKVQAAWRWWNNHVGKAALDYVWGLELDWPTGGLPDVWGHIKGAWNWWDKHIGDPIETYIWNMEVNWPDVKPPGWFMRFLKLIEKHGTGFFKSLPFIGGGGKGEEENKQKGGPIGTFIPGYGGGDVVPAMLEKGEFVWNKEMVRRFPGIIKGLWQGFKTGGPVGFAEGGEAGRSGFNRGEYGVTGPNREAESPVLRKTLRWMEKFKNVLRPHVEDTEKLNSIFGTLRTILKDVITGYQASKEEIDKLIAKQRELEKQYKRQTGVTKTFLATIKDTYKNLEGQEEISAFYDNLKQMATGQKEYISKLKTLGLSTEQATQRYNLLRQKAKELGINWDQLVGKTKQATNAMGKLSEKLGLSSGKLSSWAGTLMSSFQELAMATGELSQAEQARLSGWTGAARAAMQGNWFQAIMELFTGYMKAHIEELKAQRKELKKKIEATYDMALDGIQQVGSALGGLAGSYLGPFGTTMDSVTNSLGSFARMTVAFKRDNTLEMVKAGFEGLLTITTGLIETFGSLVKDTKAHNALQKQMNVLWAEIARAVSQALWPLAALADWATDFLGIAEGVKNQWSEIEEMNVPAGLKRVRARWKATAAGQRPTTTGGGEAAIPTWAKEIIEPLKNNLRPLLQQIKNQGGLFQIITNYIKTMWQNWAPAIASQIPRFLNWIGTAVNWLQNNLPWESIVESVVAMGQFFVNNFPGALKAFGKKFDSLLDGVFGKGNLVDQLKAVNENLKTLAKVFGAGTKVIAGMAGGAAVGAAIGSAIPGIGTVLGGAIGAGLGALGGLFFQEGGIAMSATPGIFGEAGPEAIMPLDKLPSIMNMMYGAPGVGGEQALNLSLTVQNRFDGREVNSHINEVEREINYEYSGANVGHAQHGRNRR